MNKEEVFARTLVTLADLVGEQVTLMRIKRLAWILAQELSETEFQVACREVATRETKLPPPAKFIEYAKGTARQRAEMEIARVFKAIGCYGYYQGEEARKFLGEETWRVIERMGGWANICSREGFNLNVFRAQFLNCAEAANQFSSVEDSIKKIESGQQLLQIVTSIMDRRTLQC